MIDLTPKRVVEQLDRYVIGQNDAKKAVAIAVRNRWRRQQIAPDLRDEIAPKNIIMMGPTGVGKTEIARRLATMTGAPFLKVEASKYTEVGYHGRDVESMIRDLVGVSVSMVRSEHSVRVRDKARERAEERVLDILLPPEPPVAMPPGATDEPDAAADRYEGSREAMRKKLKRGDLDDRAIDIQVREKPGMSVGVLSPQGGGMDQMGIDIQEMFGNILPSKVKSRHVKVTDAMDLFIQEEEENLFDREAINREAIERAENSGIVFIDEVDKIASSSGGGGGRGPDISREGVQRDLLPIVEGSSIGTRHGVVKTDHILFIAAGAFHQVSPSDLIPEFVGRFPIRVELDSLSEAEFARILVEPKNALIGQYKALLETEGVTLVFVEEAIGEIARLAHQANSTTQNIGARRLYTIMEKLLEDVSYEAPDLKGEDVEIDAEYVQGKLADVVESEDLTRYIL